MGAPRATNEWRDAWEPRIVADMPDHAARAEYIRRVAERDGEVAAQRLEAAYQALMHEPPMPDWPVRIARDG